MARRLDDVGGTGGQILSGFDLAYGSGCDRRKCRRTSSNLGGGLATMAIDRAGRLATEVSAARAVPIRPLAVAGGYALATIAVLGIAAIAMPRLASTEWLRLTDPLGDHPPFSRVQLTLEPENARVVYGGSLDVFATAAGEPVERVDLVLVDPMSGEEEVLPMFPEASDRWRAVLSRVTLPRQYFVRAQRARSRRFSLDVITTPRIEELRCRVSPPAYTHLGRLRRSAAVERIERLARHAGANLGDEQSAAARRHGAAVAGRRQAAQRAARSVARRRRAPEEVTGTFTLKAAGKFELQVADTDGTPAEEPISGVIHLLHDDRPFVRIRQPAAVSLATPNAALPVVVSAEDDYGISRVQLYRSLNSSRAMPVDFPLPTMPPTRTDPQDRLPLSSFGLSPGDVIRLFARVEDNDPAGRQGIGKPGRRSAHHFARGIRANAAGARGVGSAGVEIPPGAAAAGVAGEGCRRLAEEIQEAAGDKKVSSSDREALKQLARRLQEEADQLDAAAKHLLPYDIDQPLSQQLQRLARKLRAPCRRSGSTRFAIASSPARQLEQSLDDLQRELTGDEEEFDREALGADRAA